MCLHTQIPSRQLGSSYQSCCCHNVRPICAVGLRNKRKLKGGLHRLTEPTAPSRSVHNVRRPVGGFPQLVQLGLPQHGTGGRALVETGDGPSCRYCRALSAAKSHMLERKRLVHFCLLIVEKQLAHALSLITGGGVAACLEHLQRFHATASRGTQTRCQPENSSPD